MAGLIVEVEVELPEETASKLEAYVEYECLDREKWLKKLLVSGIEHMLDKDAAKKAAISKQ
jgi:hypothetical protein